MNERLNRTFKDNFDDKTDSETTEREEFIDFIETKFNNDNRFIDRVMAEALFDAGCRFK